MAHSSPRERLKIEDPVKYRIRVQGCLEEVWSDRLANMTITMDLHDKDAPASTLVGRVKDQAQLLGVLNGLYELRMPLLDVEIIQKCANKKIK